MLFCLEFRIIGDGFTRYEMLIALWNDHHLTADKYSLFQPLLATPFYLLGNWLGSPEVLIHRFNLIVFVAMLILLYVKLRKTQDRSLLLDWFLIMACCSMFPHHLRGFFPEMLTTACAVLGLALIVCGSARSGIFLLACAGINTPAWIVPITFVSLLLAYDEKKLLYLVTPLISLVAVMFESWLRRGHPLSSGYEGDHGFQTVLPYSGRAGFSYPLILGVLAILFSFGKGLIFFVPGLVLAPTASVESPILRRLQKLFLLFVIGLILVYSKWWAWYGGWYWGPRFFLMACVPASLALACYLHDQRASLAMNIATLLILLFSTWIAIDGATWAQDDLIKVGAAHKYVNEYLVWYTPEFSPLWYPIIEHRALRAGEFALAGGFLLICAWLATPTVLRVMSQLKIALHRSRRGGDQRTIGG